MSSNEARQVVQSGLERRRAEKLRREQELDRQERKLRIIINENHAAKSMSPQQKQEAVRLRREVYRQARELERAMEQAAMSAVKRYAWACGIIALVALMTPLPWWYAGVLVMGLGVFPMGYIWRLYGCG